MALLLARGRAVPLANSPFEKTKGFQTEASFRALGQLASLVRGLALIHGRNALTDHEMELARRVVFSTIPPNRAAVLAAYQKRRCLTVNQLVEAGVLEKSQAGKLLGELVDLKILTVATTPKKEHEYRPAEELHDGPPHQAF